MPNTFPLGAEHRESIDGASAAAADVENRVAWPIVTWPNAHDVRPLWLRFMSRARTTNRPAHSGGGIGA